MVLRFLLLLLILICLLIVVFIKKVKLRCLVGALAFVLSIMLVYTFTTANITVKSLSNKDIATEYIAYGFFDYNNKFSTKKDYVTKTADYTDAFSSFTYRKYSVDKMPADSEVYGIIVDSYLSGLDIPDKVMFKVLAPLITQKINENGVTFWFLPTLLEPYNPNSFLLKGCLYTGYYYNTFAWYQDGYLNVIYESCSSDIGKTDEQHLTDFIENWDTANGSVSSDEK